MAEVIKEKYNPIQYADPYPKKNPEELQGYATTIIDGKGWRIQMPDELPGVMRSVCIGPVDVVDGKAVPQKKKPPVPEENLEKGVTDITPDSDESDSSGVENPVKKLNKGNHTTGRPPTLVPEEFLNSVKEKGLTSRESSLLYEAETGKYISYVTFSKLLKGERLLI